MDDVNAAIDCTQYVCGITNKLKSETEKLQIKAFQLPILINNASTGRNLQCSGVDNLFVHNWSYLLNWKYTMHIYITSIAGLLARTLYPQIHQKYSLPSN
jgi:hypothetical protein